MSEQNITVNEGLKRDWWGIDSMASVHVTGNRKSLVNVKRVAPMMVSVADGRQIMITEAGTALLRLQPVNGNRPVEWRVRDVYYHHAINANLLSARRLVREFDLTLVSKQDASYLESNKGTKYKLHNIGNVTVIRPSGSEYIGALHQPVHPATVNSVGQVRAGERIITTVEDVCKLHHIVGHVSLNTLIKMSASGKIDGLGAIRISKQTYARADAAIKTCVACMKAKEHATPLGNKGLDRGTRAGEVLHMDTFTIVLKNESGQPYYEYELVIKDSYSSAMFTYYITSKTQVADRVIACLNMIRTNYDNQPVKRLHTDMGTEFINHTLIDYCKSEGIELSYSPAGKKQLNGIAERAVKEMKLMTGAFMNQCMLPSRFLHHATQYAAHVWNRTYIDHRTGVTPYEAYYKKRPDITHLAAFGCDAYVYVTKEKRDGPLASRVKLGVYLGVHADTGVR